MSFFFVYLVSWSTTSVLDCEGCLEPEAPSQLLVRDVEGMLVVIELKPVRLPGFGKVNQSIYCRKTRIFTSPRLCH